MHSVFLSALITLHYWIQLGVVQCTGFHDFDITVKLGEVKKVGISCFLRLLSLCVSTAESVFVDQSPVPAGRRVTLRLPPSQWNVLLQGSTVDRRISFFFDMWAKAVLWRFNQKLFLTWLTIKCMFGKFCIEKSNTCIYFIPGLDLVDWGFSPEHHCSLFGTMITSLIVKLFTEKSIQILWLRTLLCWQHEVMVTIMMQYLFSEQKVIKPRDIYILN